MNKLILIFGSLLLAASAAAQPPGDTADPGRTLFFRQGCYGCHRLGIAVTPIAYDLSHVGRKYSQAQLEQWLRDPKSQKPTAHMPRLALTEEEIRVLAGYLASLR
jgi:cbb3-type cytochrome oxidase cytochrome c subunit